jgi:hypothetical protein
MSYEQKVQYINSHVAERDVRLQGDPRFKEEYFKQNPAEQEAWESRQASVAEAKAGTQVLAVKIFSFIHFDSYFMIKNIHTQTFRKVFQLKKHWPRRASRK